jgi:hypothetical protein
LANPDFREYTKSLDPMHHPPHHLEINRIIEVMLDVGMEEFVRILQDRRQLLCYGFMSGSIDFWTNSTRRAAFGVLMLDLVAEQYTMTNGRKYFMSHETASRLKEQLMSVSVYNFTILIQDFESQLYNTNLLHSYAIELSSPCKSRIPGKL